MQQEKEQQDKASKTTKQQRENAIKIEEQVTNREKEDLTKNIMEH